jgi:hypothetical protein
MVKWKIMAALSAVLWLTAATATAQHDEGVRKSLSGKPKWERGGKGPVEKSVHQQYRGRFQEAKRKRSENRKRYAHLKPGCARD